MHCRHGNLDSALEILKYACTNKKSKLNQNIKCWQFYIDLLLNLYDLEAAEGKDEGAKGNPEEQKPGTTPLDVAEYQVREAYTKTLDL